MNWVPGTDSEVDRPRKRAPARRLFLTVGTQSSAIEGSTGNGDLHYWYERNRHAAIRPYNSEASADVVPAAVDMFGMYLMKHTPFLKKLRPRASRDLKTPAHILTLTHGVPHRAV